MCWRPPNFSMRKDEEGTDQGFNRFPKMKRFGNFCQNERRPGYNKVRFGPYITTTYESHAQ